jgi:hypothetical protein
VRLRMCHALPAPCDNLLVWIPSPPKFRLLPTLLRAGLTKSNSNQALPIRNQSFKLRKKSNSREELLMLDHSAHHLSNRRIVPSVAVMAQEQATNSSQPANKVDDNNYNNMYLEKRALPKQADSNFNGPRPPDVRSRL